MCGITGIYCHSTLPEDSETRLKQMMQRIDHRGPDEAGMYLSDQLVMGTVRLNIMGVNTGTGHQPICDEHERYFLSYNGEVYNYIELQQELMALGYQFYTTSDTEVVLRAWQAWGVGCLTRFNGAFAFAIYDSSDKSLYLARDRFGKRPLFYTQHNGAVYFSSEMKSFLCVPDFQFEFDTEQLASILTLWTPLPQQSSYKNIHQVPNDSYMVIKDGQSHTHQYYSMDFQSDISISSEAHAQQIVADSLRHSVQLRLRSDVGVGVYLSGGLDSSIIAALVAEKMGSRLKTYSVTFEDKEFDESAEQEAMVQRLNSEHYSLYIRNKDIVDAFPNAIYHGEIPVFRTAFVPMYLMSREVRNDGTKVVISGEGADEAFLGYNLFKETRMRSMWQDLNDADRFNYLSELYPYLSHYQSSDVLVLSGLYQQFSKERNQNLFSHDIRIQNGHFAKRLLDKKLDGLAPIASMLKNNRIYHQLTDIQKAQWLEFNTLLPGYLLSTQGDRASLAHSVENRCPFLDPNLVRVSNAVNQKFDLEVIEKKVLRDAFREQLPERIFSKRKQPYRAPDSKAFVEHQPDYFELLLSNNEISKMPFLNQKFCSLLTKKIMNTPAKDIGIKENQAFMFLLSICLLNHQYVEKNTSEFVSAHDIEKNMMVRIDKRTMIPKNVKWDLT